MIEVQILIPANDNQGQLYSSTMEAIFQSELNALFGGHSVLPAAIVGQWIDGGVVYPDQSRVFMVLLPSLCDGGKIRDAVEFAKTHYQQLKIYVRYLGIGEII